MNLERVNLAGTPVVVAPEAIYLVGDPGLPSEEIAVLVALSRYATAQYLPDVVPLSPLVDAVVNRARNHLGQVAAALPSGSVQLSAAKAWQDGETLTYGTTPAIAVATAAAVFEATGQSITDRGNDILAVAEAAHRAMHGEMQVKGELAAARHGGLIKVVSQARATQRICLAPQADLHLVIFRTGRPLYPDGWLSSIHLYSECAPSTYQRILANLTNEAEGFATGLSQGEISSAIDSAGRYGHLVMQLASAASAPLQSETLLRAMELAEVLGGIAKPMGAGHCDLGLALFATPEAAGEFVCNCEPPLVPLRVEIDRLGVRCLHSNPTGEWKAFSETTAVVHRSRASIQAIMHACADDPEPHAQEFDPDSLVARTDPELPVVVTDPSLVAITDPSLAAELDPESLVEELDPASLVVEPAPASLVVEPAPDSLPQAPIPEPLVVQQERVLPPRRRRWVGPAIGGGLVVAALLAVWLIRTHGRHDAPTVESTGRPPSYVIVLPLPPTPAPAPAAPDALPVAPPAPIEPAAAPAASSSDPQLLRHSPPVLNPVSHAARSSAKRLVAPRAASTKPARPPAPRAGHLTADDF